MSAHLNHVIFYKGMYRSLDKFLDFLMMAAPDTALPSAAAYRLAHEQGFCHSMDVRKFTVHWTEMQRELGVKT